MDLLSLDLLFKNEGNLTIIDWDSYGHMLYDFRDELLAEIIKRGLLTTEKKGYLIITNSDIHNPKLDGKTLYFVQQIDAENFAKKFLSNTKYDWLIQAADGEIIATKKQLIPQQLGQTRY
jgi:hypothetical protein